MKCFLKYLYITSCLLLVACDNDNNADMNPISTPNPPDSIAYEQYGTPFNQLPQTEDIVLYAVNLRAMSANGDIQGVIDKLDHISSLGANMIWLLPIHPQGELRSIGSPYAVKDYKTVGTEYGNLQDLRRLTDAAHARGIGVLMDWVANHTAWDHPWIANKSWYTQNASGQIISPPGTSWNDVADLNYDQQEMRKEMIDAMKYWIYEANIDGYRCDYADGVPADFWSAAWSELGAIPNRKIIRFAEGNRPDHFNNGFEMNFGFRFYGGILNAFDGHPAATIFSTAAAEYANVPAGKHFIRYTTNHDESAWNATPIQVYGNKQGAMCATAITVFMDGIPLIYSSQEVGRSSNLPFFSNDPIDWTENPDMLLTYQHIMAYYTSSNVARKGAIQTYADNDVAVFKKTLNGDDVLIIANIRNQQVNYTIPTALNNTSWNNVLNQNTVQLAGQITLSPYQFYILN